MAVEKVISLTDTKERVAFELMEKVLSEEWVRDQKLDRKHILDLYAECLQAAGGYRNFPGK